MNARIFAGDGGTSPILFWFGTIAVTVGVGFHIPMFLESASMSYRLAGMAIDPMMLVGMALIVIGTVVAGYGLSPKASEREPSRTIPDEFAQAGHEGEGKLTAAHWQLMTVLTFALIIDTMKPASLGFVVPGMAQEYGLSRPVVALLPFFALTGTALGSLFWGYLADVMGRRAAILLAAIMFIGTAICGAMPSFVWNIVMCFLMGASAGGMLPITYTLLAETVPAYHRGWFLVLLGGLGLAGGYLAASGCAALLEPHFGWRIMWLLGLPTGLLLIVLNQFIPESPRFLLLQGRVAEAGIVLARFKTSLPAISSTAEWVGSTPTEFRLGPSLAATTASLNLAALAWGLVNFGLLLWLPTNLRENGVSVANSDALLAGSSVLALPTSAAAAWMYARWSTKWTLVVFLLFTTAGSFGFSLLGSGLPAIGNNPIVLITIIIIGSNGLISVLMPYSAESYPLRLRGRGTGMVAGSSKLGGIAAQLVSMFTLVPGLAGTALILSIPVLVSAAMVGRYGAETRGRRL
jgi:putative MFS transporter